MATDAEWNRLQRKKEREAKGLTHHGFEPGHQLWKNAIPFKPRIYANEELLLEACRGYFEWCISNPIVAEQKTVDGVLVDHIVKPRAFTIAGLCVHIGICRTTWFDYRKAEDLGRICDAVDCIIWEQKFTGAAAGAFNANLIARELGLVDKTESTMKHTHAVDRVSEKTEAILGELTGDGEDSSAT